MSFTIKLNDKEVYDHCEKHHLKIVDPDGNKLIKQRVSFSNWQLEDSDYDKRVKQWAERRISKNIDREKDINLDYSI